MKSCDTASKADELNNYSVCTTRLMKGKDYNLLDVTRDRLEYPYLKHRVADMHKKYAAHCVLIEDKDSGTQLIQELRYEKTGVRPVSIKPSADKITRMSNQSAKIQAGQVHLPERANWLDTSKTEILAFPPGKYDDQVDSVSQFLNWIDERRKRMSRSGRAIGWYAALSAGTK